MTMQEITIHVTPDAAATYLAASDEDRRKLDALLSLRFSEAAEWMSPASRRYPGSES